MIDIILLLLCRNARPQTGYILGVATVSPAIPERSLSPAASTIIKILMHSGLIWTSCSKAVYQLYNNGD